MNKMAQSSLEGITGKIDNVPLIAIQPVFRVSHRLFDVIHQGTEVNPHLFTKYRTISSFCGTPLSIRIFLADNACCQPSV